MNMSLNIVMVTALTLLAASAVSAGKAVKLKLTDATQSTDAHSGVAGRAIDGDINGWWDGNSCTHTENENKAWWQAKISERSAVGKIIVSNRVDCCSSRLTGVKVYVDDHLCGTLRFVGGVSQYPVNCGGAIGSVIRIEQSNDVLTLCEVVAWGEPKPEVCGCDNINGDAFEATDINYDLDNKIVTAVRPDLVVNKELTNRGSRDLVVPLSQQVEVWKMMEFSHTSGATVKVGTSFNVGVPGLGAASVSAEVSGSYQFSSGEKTTTKRIIKVAFSCTAPPQKRAVCNAMMRKDKVSIPYVMTWTHKRLDGCTCKEEGVFEEMVSNKVEMDIQEFDLNTKKMIRTKREEILNLQTI